MKLLFCVQLIIEMDHPWLYTNFLTNYFNRYMALLEQEESTLEFAVLMGEAPKMVYKGFPNVRKYIVTQKQMSENGKYSCKEILKEYFRYCHERTNEPPFMDYHVGLIRSIVDFDPDIIISRDNAPYLEKCFPEALMLYTEVGFVSRKPFEQTMYFDVLGMNCGSYLHRYWERIEADIWLDRESREWICKLKKAVRTCIMEHNPYIELIRLWRERFNKLYLLPLQFSGFSNIDGEIGFESQFDVLLYVFDKVPSNVGIVVTTHPDYNLLNAGMLKFLKGKYPNLLYSESFLDYNASSQYLLGLVDGIINLSSTVGLQTLFWDIPCISLGKYFASYISRQFREDSSYEPLSEKEIERNDKVLFWLVTRYIIPPEYLWDPKRLYSLLVNLYRRYKKGAIHEFYQPFEPPKKAVERMIRSLDSHIPEPRGRLLNIIDENNILNPEKKKRVIIFGTGAVYKRNKRHLENFSIVAFLDNDPSKQGTVLDGVRIVSPAEVLNYCYDAILLLSDAHDDMRQQLKQWKELDGRQIYSADELGKWLYISEERSHVRETYLQIKGGIHTAQGKTALLVSNRMDFTGAALVLFHAAAILKKNGIYTVVCSSMHGEVEQLYKGEGIPFLFEPTLNRYNEDFWQLADQCDLLLVNTLLEKELIYGLKNTKTKCIWWIHESDDRCKEADSKKLVDAFGRHLSIYGVGRRVTDTFAAMETWKDVDVRNMLFGVPDKKRKTGGIKKRICEERKLNIYLVGSIYSVKGQDLFARAIGLLPEDVKNKCRFLLVGNILSEDYYRHVMKECSNVEYLGVRDREEMQELYEDMDIMVCPSRRDSLPVVTVEAMMNKKTVIVSDSTGTAYYIKNGINGFVFEKENIQELADKLTCLILDPSCLDHIGMEARKTYEQYFSMEIFEKNFMKMITDELSESREEK